MSLLSINVADWIILTLITFSIYTEKLTIVRIQSQKAVKDNFNYIYQVTMPKIFSLYRNQTNYSSSKTVNFISSNTEGIAFIGNVQKGILFFNFCNKEAFLKKMLKKIYFSNFIVSRVEIEPGN